ncbi:hypothetical protein MTR_8g107150 [Medicago truncatula]|uniref:Uncharacterized protein n=1 Tax=Medicago truncatula TaxID=3880 RepID=G7LDC9_MEDTR|nr:hypothetical protein MTR_8g107150 [Medicago truncatula]
MFSILLWDKQNPKAKWNTNIIIKGIVVPVLVYKGIVREFHMQDEDNGRTCRKFKNRRFRVLKNGLQKKLWRSFSMLRITEVKRERIRGRYESIFPP